MVINILKDGTRVDDLTGYVVKMDDAVVAYEVLKRITREVRAQNEKDDS